MPTRHRRRRPVPRQWRDRHHHLSLHSYRRYGVGGWGRLADRASGTCSCGTTFGKAAGRHNMNADDVRDAWRDHVEDAYYLLANGAEVIEP